METAQRTTPAGVQSGSVRSGGVNAAREGMASSSPAIAATTSSTTSSSTTTTSSTTTSSTPAPRPGAHDIAHRLNEAAPTEDTHIASLVSSLGRGPYLHSLLLDPLPERPVAGGDAKSFTRPSTRKEARSAPRQPVTVHTLGGATGLETKRTPPAAHPLESKGRPPGSLMDPPPVVVEIAGPAPAGQPHRVFSELVRTGMKEVRGLGRTLVIDTLPPAASQPAGLNRNLLTQFQTPPKGDPQAAPAVLREEEDELRDGARQPPANARPAPPRMRTRMEPPPPAAEPREGRDLAQALNLQGHEVLEARLAGCRRLADLRVQRGEQDPGYLDRLHREYLARVPTQVHMHHERTLEAVATLVDYDIAPQQLPQASFWGRVRDFFTQMSATQDGYLSSWYPAGAITLALINEDKDEMAKILFPALMASAGLLMGIRFLRKGDLFTTWTRPYSFDHQNNVAVGTLEGWNFLRSVAAYWGFAPTLALISHFVLPPDDVADPTARRKAHAIALTQARMKYNFISTALVGLHRYFMLPRELTFLNPLDPPGTPEDRRGEARRAMVGAIQELSAPRGRRYPGLVAAGKSGLAVGGYVKHLFIGAGRTLLVDEAWNAAKAWRDGRPVTFQYSADSATRDISRLCLLFTAAIVLNLLRTWGNRPWEDSTKWNDVLDIAALPLLWGLGTALADRLNLDNQSIRDDNTYNETRRRARLAQGVPLQPVPPAAVAPAESTSQLEPEAVNLFRSPAPPRPAGGSRLDPVVVIPPDRPDGDPPPDRETKEGPHRD